MDSESLKVVNEIVDIFLKAVCSGVAIFVVLKSFSQNAKTSETMKMVVDTLQALQNEVRTIHEVQLTWMKGHSHRTPGGLPSGE